MTPFVLIAAAAILSMIYFARKKPEKSVNWLQFYAKGKEAGFTIKELEHLRHMASGCNIEDPSSIFVSQKPLETCIRAVVSAVRMSGDSEGPLIQDFLSKLFDFCKQMEMKNAEKNSSIKDSRQISEGQALKVLLQGTGIFTSEVIKNTSSYLTISRPENPKITASLQWIGMKISIYFWREDDAGYVFDAFVEDEVFSKGISSLKVEHNDSLFRTQKRKSLRAKLNKAAFVYLVNDADPFKMEKRPGLRCMIEDISDTGCAFRVYGRAPVGRRFKLQFSLDRVPICMPGTVRSVDFNEGANVSLVRMESDILSTSVRNHILCEVFDLLPDEDEDELPFRVIEEEADNSKPEADAQPAEKFQEAANG